MTLKGEYLTIKGENPFGAPIHKNDILVSYIRQEPAPEKLANKRIAVSAPGIVCQMLFVIKGTLSFFIKDRPETKVDIDASRHNLMHVTPDVLFNIEAGEPCEAIFIQLSRDFLQKHLPSIHWLHIKMQKGIQKDKLMLFQEPYLHTSPELSSILHSIENSPHSGFCGKLFLESKVLELLVLQLTQAESATGEEVAALKKEDKEKMNEVKEILIEHFESPPSLIVLAHMVGTNEFNLKKNFKIAFGTTVYGYLNQYKMELAKSMLIRGDSKISEVSGKMGYRHPTHFTSAFKKYFGYLPNKIRSYKLSVLFYIEELYLIYEPYTQHLVM